MKLAHAIQVRARALIERPLPKRVPTHGELSAVPLEQLLQYHYTISDQLHYRINRQVPNIKLRRHGFFSFTDFVLTHIDTARPVTVLDIGAGDCFLDWTLSGEMHEDSTFECYDTQRRAPLFVNDKVTFFEQDAVTKVTDSELKTYDYAIASGFLGLLPTEQKDAVMHALRSARGLFIRENPRFSNLIDAFCGPQLTKYNDYPNTFSERSLKELLAKHDFEILALEHEFDIYVAARPRHPRSAKQDTSVSSPPASQPPGRLVDPPPPVIVARGDHS